MKEKDCLKELRAIKDVTSPPWMKKDVPRPG